MGYFSDDMPVPSPNMDDAGFWEHCARRELRFQACADCGLLRHPPIPMCGACGSARVNWVAAPQEAEVYTYTVVHHASHECVASRLPYVVAVVSFPGLGDVRLITNITDIDPAQVRIGMRLRMWWDTLSDGSHVPRFRPLEGGTS